MTQDNSIESSFPQDPDDIPANSRPDRLEKSFAKVAEGRLSRRALMQGAVASTGSLGIAALPSCSSSSFQAPSQAKFRFTEIAHGIDEHHHVAPDHEAEVLIRWGDPIFDDSPAFDPENQTADAQERQFGYNNDFIGFLPLAPSDDGIERALLCVNHEYCKAQLMFPDLPENPVDGLTRDLIEVEQAATGNSIIEIIKTEGKWRIVQDSAYNRRISARSTEVEISGPAAGHDRLKTNADPTGKKVIGTVNNCAGGMTPWGTYLTCEENINYYFDGELPEGHSEATNHSRYGVPGNYFRWGRFDSRFNIATEPNEPNRFGWVMEIDPLDPTSTPKKRTALGRFKHEGAGNAIAPSGQLVVYMGDDQRFDYLYKFVSRDAVVPNDKAANRDLLDHGTLYVARFLENGVLDWLPLTYGKGPLLAENGFHSQADVVIEARRAADLLGATPMDRPEDVVPNPSTGRVYAMLTNNTRREEPNVANPEAPNPFGHIIEITEPSGNFAAETSSWDFLIKGGDPENPSHNAQFNPVTSENGWFINPDNGVIDPAGRLWISTDQGDRSAVSGTCDGLWAMETEGGLRGKGQMFFRCPVGAELCGPAFSEQADSLFVAVQHPGADDLSPDLGTYSAPATRWPDFDENMPPRPSVVVLSKKGGGPIG